ncbi:MAG: divalent-cation tolerance protein CutA [Planctomycetota bacterium]|nr:divalent-cation tolerance protein CutA [Planctomycetota bacterium]
MLRVLLVTAPKEKAEGLARALLKERLIACANLLPGATSLFWWDGKIDTARETLMVLKAPARNVRKLLARIPALHPYDVPEVLVLNVAAAYRPYAKWVDAETKRRPAKR